MKLMLRASLLLAAVGAQLVELDDVAFVPPGLSDSVSFRLFSLFIVIFFSFFLILYDFSLFVARTWNVTIQ